MEKSNRIEWIDYAKVIGIWLVIFGHILNSGRPIERELYILIYSFHMPFFFFVSGLLFSTKNMEFVPFVKSKIKSLLVPYVLLNILCVILSIPLYIYPDVFATTNLQLPKHDLLTLVDGTLGSVFAPPTWFLISLFFVMIISFFVTKLSIWLQLLIVAVGIAMSYVSMIYQIPLNLDTIPVGFVFFSVGQMLKGRVKDISMNIWFFVLLFVVIMVIYTSLSLFNGKVTINNIIGRNNWLYWINAIFGICALYVFSNMIACALRKRTYTQQQTVPIIQLVSGGTIFILSVHETFIVYMMDYFLVNHSFHIPLVLREIILATIILIICIPFIQLARRYVPILIGNRK